MKNYALLVLAALITCSCAPQNAATGAVAGAAAGGVIGQVIGKETESTLIGSAIGGAIGYILTKSMTGSDREKFVNVYEYNPDNHSSKWINEQTGNEFSATPQLTYVDEKNGLNCRDVEVISVVNGKLDRAVSTACRKDGEWYFQ